MRFHSYKKSQQPALPASDAGCGLRRWQEAPAMLTGNLGGQPSDSAAPRRGSAQPGRPMRCRRTALRKQEMTSVSSTCCAMKCSATASSSCSRDACCCCAAGRWYTAPYRFNADVCSLFRFIRGWVPWREVCTRVRLPMSSMRAGGGTEGGRRGGRGRSSACGSAGSYG